MNDQLKLRTKKSGLYYWSLWFIRMVALVCLAQGVYYWVRLIGYYPGLLWRFDLMPWQWQAACVTLAALLPIAAIGMWMRASWGALLWAMAALLQIMMYSFLSNMFEYYPIAAALNAGLLLVYAGLRIGLLLQGRPTLTEPT